MLVGDDDIVSWRKPFNTPLGSFHTCCRRQPTKAALRLYFENVELRHGVAVTKKQWVGTDIESQARLAVHKMRGPHPFVFGFCLPAAGRKAWVLLPFCFSLANLSLGLVRHHRAALHDPFHVVHTTRISALQPVADGTFSDICFPHLAWPKS